jgi:hypothetical protein
MKNTAHSTIFKVITARLGARINLYTADRLKSSDLFYISPVERLSPLKIGSWSFLFSGLARVKRI